MTSAETYIKSKLDERRASGVYRSLKPENSLIDFCSNDYLGFARSAILKHKIETELQEYPSSLNGSTGSRLLSGNLNYTESLENEIAAHHQYEAGLLFGSGYNANLGLLSALAQRGDTIILDELIHASVIDGARLSYANRYSFKHNDPNSLEDKLKHAKGNCYVVIESVYSMDGDTPPLLDLLTVTEKYGAHLIVDEAHAVGLYPAGLIGELGLQSRVFASVVTFGKALGCHGAIVLGSNLLREYLVNFARSFIYTTAPAFHQLVAIKMAYKLLNNAAEEIACLKGNIKLFKDQFNTNNIFPLLMSDSAIQCIILKNNNIAQKMANILQDKGLDIRAILSPTVASGTERIRICLHAYNTTNDINKLTTTINQFINAC